MNEIALQETVDDVIRNKQAAVDKILEGVAAIIEARDLLKKYGVYLPDCVSEELKYKSGKITREEVEVSIDRDLWRWIINHTSVGRLMTAEQRKSMDEGFSSRPRSWKDASFPRLTEDNVMSTVLKVAADAPELLEKSVVKLFEDLSYDHKSNDGFSFGDRWIFKGVQCRWGFVQHHTAQKLYEIERVVDLVEGRMPASHAHVAPLYGAVSQSVRVGGGEAETESIKCKLFKNGNGHFWLKNQETIDRMNAIVAKRVGGHVLGKAGGK